MAHTRGPQDRPNGAVHQSPDSFEEYKDRLLANRNYRALHREVYAAARYLEDVADRGVKLDNDTTNNITSLVCALSRHLRDDVPKPETVDA